MATPPSAGQDDKRSCVPASTLGSPLACPDLLDAIPQMLWTTDASGAVTYHNQQMYDFTGVRRATAEGSAWMDVVHPEDRERAVTSWQAALAKGTPYECTYRIRHNTGEYRWTIARGNPLRNDRGEVVAWVGTNTDIHEQHQARAALEENARRKNDFLAMLSHELRNPLSPIVSAVDLLTPLVNTNPIVERVRDVLQRQVGHLVNLVDDLLEASRVTRKQVVLEKLEVNLVKVALEAVEQVRPRLESKGQSLALRLPYQPIWTRGDHRRLVQVVANLLSNAARYTQDGGVVEVGVDEGAADVRLWVQDNGIGMSPETLRNAFELFYQGENPDSAGAAGLGVGLALVKSLVEQHRGHVEAASKGPGQGSRFTVFLPKV